MTIGVVDFFCGAGGLSYGLKRRGLKVRAGIDIDPACRHPFVKHTGGKFLGRDLSSFTATEIRRLFKRGDVTVLAGCAPCQPFSTYALGKRDSSDERWSLLSEFSRLVEELRPAIVTMENVPGLAVQSVFEDFLDKLVEANYVVSFGVVSCRDYGIPQSRSRLVLMASRFGPIDLLTPDEIQFEVKTVHHAISHLPRIAAGEMCKKDLLHKASRLSKLNLQRIRASLPGGTWRDWPDELVAVCHQKKRGKTFPGVYGRMKWDAPSPTITTQFFGFGNGRFGHPEQNRGLSLREGAILQGFPEKFEFVKPGEHVSFKRIGRMIGNSVPVGLGEIIGETIKAHVESYGR